MKLSSNQIVAVMLKSRRKKNIFSYNNELVVVALLVSLTHLLFDSLYFTCISYKEKKSFSPAPSNQLVITKHFSSCLLLLLLL